MTNLDENASMLAGYLRAHPALSRAPPRASTSAVTRAATRQHPPRLMGHWPQRIVWAGATDLEAGLVVLDKGLVRV